ncbi:outer membrane lipoprotein carrier protein LolA [Sphingomonas changnyeongensis]|uniref:Outer membrane lipoprotein carrier protein LolA n=2 Tax=Sphingomonas changnyeongensis TaxID=2698679 RepID=A0A7Z2NYS4_9SPHN|nr:outer membrane lipoprotein carrier protein LolA [Sphingomonas changnyeongensis]
MPALLVPAMAAAQAQAPAQPGGDLARVGAHLRGLAAMTADFTQTDRTGKTLTGTLSLKQPGKIRFQYAPGVPLLVVSDGRALSFVDYQVRQVSRWPIGGSPLGVLLDPRKDLSRVARIVPSGQSDVVNVLVRDPKHPEYGAITLAFTQRGDAPGGLLLQGWVALDAQNNRTTVRLANQRLNPPLSDTLFRFTDPRRDRQR